jgi:hypothetical protein
MRLYCSLCVKRVMPTSQDALNVGGWRQRQSKQGHIVTSAVWLHVTARMQHMYSMYLVLYRYCTVRCTSTFSIQKGEQFLEKSIPNILPPFKIISFCCNDDIQSDGHNFLTVTGQNLLFLCYAFLPLRCYYSIMSQIKRLTKFCIACFMSESGDTANPTMQKVHVRQRIGGGHWVL